MRISGPEERAQMNPEKPSSGDVAERYRGLDDAHGRSRTFLANERTFLAYLRTALTFFVAGVTFVRFFGHPSIVALGWLFIPVGIVVLVVGIHRFRRMGQIIKKSDGC